MGTSEGEENIVEIDIETDNDQTTQEESNELKSEEIPSTRNAFHLDFSEYKKILLGYVATVQGYDRTSIAVTVLSIVMALSVLVVIVLLATLHSPDPTCYRNGCIKQGVLLSKVMNFTAEPCEDFYEYACGRLNEAGQLSFGIITKLTDILRKQNTQKFFNLLTHRSLYHKGSAIGKMKKIYSQCMKEMDHTIRPGSLNKFVRDIGGWSLFTAFDQDNWDFSSSLRKLREHYNTGILFSFRYVHASNKIYIEKATTATSMFLFLGGRKVNSKSQYGKVMLTLMNQLKKDRLFRNKNPSALWDAESATDSILAIDKAVHDFWLRVDESDEFVVSLDEIDKKSSSIGWRTYLRLALGDAVINRDAKIVVPGEMFLQNIDQMVDRFNATSWNHYFSFIVIRQYLNFMGPEYSVIHRDLNQLEAGFSFSETRAKECFSLVDHFMPLAVRALLLHAHIGHENVHAAMNMYDKMNHTMVRGLSWMSEKSRRQVLQFLGKIKVNYGFTRLVRSMNRLDHHYYDLKLKRSVIETVAALQRFYNTETQMMIASLATETELENDLWLLRPALNMDLSYDMQSSTVHIPFTALQIPTFDKDLPEYVNAASLGTSVLNLLHVLTIVKRSSTLLDRKSIEKLNDYRKCLSSNFKNYGELKNLKFDVDVAQSESIAAINHLVANHATFTLLEKEYLERAREEAYVLPAEYLNQQEATAQKQFYLSFAQHYCEVIRGKYDLQLKIQYGTTPSRHMVNNFVYNSDRFKNAFQCVGVPDAHVGDTCSLHQ